MEDFLNKKPKFYLKISPPMTLWNEVTEKEYKNMEISCGFYSKSKDEIATHSFGIIKNGIEISGKIKF